MFFNTIIKGTGHFLSKNIIKNNSFLKNEFYDDKGEIFDISNEDIISKFEQITEITERRYIEDTMNNSDQALEASLKAIEDWRGEKENIDYIIFAHNFGDVGNDKNVDITPSLSSRLKHKLGIKNRKCIAYDMVFGCPGWVEGFILADKLIQSKQAKNILIVGAETLSRVSDPYDRNKMIFSDGAGAVIISGEEEENKRGVLSSATYCDTQEELNYLKNSKSSNPNYTENNLFLKMLGRKVYEYAITNVPKAIKELIDELKMNLSDFKKLLIHQANAKMDNVILKKLLKLYKMNLSDLVEDFMPMTIQSLGNSSVATVPTMLDLILKGNLSPHKIIKGDNIIFASVGAGMNINAFAYKF